MVSNKFNILIEVVSSLLLVNFSSLFLAIFDVGNLGVVKEVINIFVSLFVLLYWVVKLIKEKQSSNGK